MRRLITRLLLAAMVLLVLLVVWCARPIRPVKAKREATRSQLAILQQGVREFVSRTGRQPTEPEGHEIIGQALKGRSGDPWGNPYRFVLINGEARMVSAGPDRQFGTADDLIGQ